VHATCLQRNAPMTCLSCTDLLSREVCRHPHIAELFLGLDEAVFMYIESIVVSDDGCISI
jgi:hypothetical protein